MQKLYPVCNNNVSISCDICTEEVARNSYCRASAKKSLTCLLPSQAFFCAFWGKLDFTKKLKTRFFPLKLDFFPPWNSIFRPFYANFIFHDGKFEWGDPFYATFINKFFEKSEKNSSFWAKMEEILIKVKKFVLKNSETRF